jgi:hypothetical protein
MIQSIITKLVLFRNYLLYKKFDFLATIRSQNIKVDLNSRFIISISSYPKRIHLVPAVFESLFYQKCLPMKFLLVLTEEEWFNKEVPKSIEKLEKLGVEILWIKGNTFAVKNISPVVEVFPDDDIIIFDDDIIYGPLVVSDLSESEYIKRGEIVGHVGKVILKKGKSLSMWYRSDEPANLNTQSECVFFIGYGGVYYPKNSLDKRVSDLEAIKRVVPGRGKDVWLYCATISQGTRQFCLGSDNKKGYYIPIPINDKTKAKDTPGADIMENRFQMAIDYFGIREKLLDTLPNQE